MTHHGLHLGEHAGGVHIVLASSTSSSSSSSLVPWPVTRPGPLVVLAVAVTVTLGGAGVSGGQDGHIGGRSSVPNRVAFWVLLNKKKDCYKFSLNFLATIIGDTAKTRLMQSLQCTTGNAIAST